MRCDVVHHPLRRRVVRRMHRPELQQPERPPVAARALLNEEHRPARIQLDEQGDQRQQRRDEHQADRRRPTMLTRRAVSSGGAVVAESLRQDQRARPERLDRHLAGEPLVELDRILDVDAADARFEQRLQRQAVAPVLDGDDDPRRPHARDDLVELVAACRAIGRRAATARRAAGCRPRRGRRSATARAPRFPRSAVRPWARRRESEGWTASLGPHVRSRSARPGSPRRTRPGSTRGSTRRSSRRAAGRRG